MLQTAMEERGGIFEGAPIWTDHVEIDNRLITGQNPQSALSGGKALLKELQ